MRHRRSVGDNCLHQILPVFGELYFVEKRFLRVEIHFVPEWVGGHHLRAFEKLLIAFVRHFGSRQFIAYSAHYVAGVCVRYGHAYVIIFCSFMVALYELEEWAHQKVAVGIAGVVKVEDTVVDDRYALTHRVLTQLVCSVIVKKTDHTDKNP